MRNLLVIDPNADAFMRVTILAVGAFCLLHAENLAAADYMSDAWAQVAIIDPLIAPMDGATALVSDLAERMPTVVWTGLQPAAIPACPVQIIQKADTLELAEWLLRHR